MMTLNDFPGNGKAKAGTSGFAGAGFVDPIKPVKNSFAVLFRYADSVVPYLHPDCILLTAGGNTDMTAVWGVFNRVS